MHLLFLRLSNALGLSNIRTNDKATHLSRCESICHSNCLEVDFDYMRWYLRLYNATIEDRRIQRVEIYSLPAASAWPSLHASSDIQRQPFDGAKRGTDIMSE